LLAFLNLTRTKPADINNSSNNRSINTTTIGCILADSAKRKNKLASSDRIMSNQYKVLRPAIYKTNSIITLDPSDKSE